MVNSSHVGMKYLADNKSSTSQDIKLEHLPDLGKYAQSYVACLKGLLVPLLFQMCRSSEVPPDLVNEQVKAQEHSQVSLLVF